MINNCIILIVAFIFSLFRTSVGCDVDFSYVDPSIVWVYYAIATTTFQIMLMGLFIYPLVKHRSIAAHAHRAGTRGRRLLPLIRRSFTTCCVCILTDIVSSLVVLLVKDSYNITPIAAYNINLVTNLICIILSFAWWRKILFPYRTVDRASFSSNDVTGTGHSNNNYNSKIVRQDIEATSPNVKTVSSRALGLPPAIYKQVPCV